jgi:hypothetical protein
MDLVRYALDGCFQMTNCSLLYYKVGDQKNENAIGSIYHHLEAISILRASALNEIVSIPALKVSITRSQVSCIVRGDKPIIYISSTAEPDLAITVLSGYIAEILDAAPYAGDVRQLLLTEDTDTLFNDLFRLPPLPDSGDMLMVDDSEIATHLFEDAMEEILEDIGSPHPLPDESDEIEFESITVETADAASQDEYRALISAVDRDFREKLKHNRCKDLSRGCKTGFAGELLVVSLTVKFTDLRFFSC